MKSILTAALILALAGCTPAAPGAANPAAGGTPTAGAPIGKLTTVTNAELDALIACAGTKGSVGAIVVSTWTALRTMPESERAAIKPALEVQAKALGCL